MRKELVIAGRVIIVLGTLFFALSQETRIRQDETPTLAYLADILWVISVILALVGVLQH